MNDFIVRATALALTDVPRANSQWDAKSGEVVPCQSVDISIAVATDKGLITPIVKDANKKSLTQISAEVSYHCCCSSLLSSLTCEDPFEFESVPVQGPVQRIAAQSPTPARLWWHCASSALHLQHLQMPDCTLLHSSSPLLLC